MESFSKNTSNSEKDKNGWGKNIIKASVVAGILAAAPTMKAEALEIEPTASWNQGIDAAKNSVQEDINETQFTFFKTGEGVGYWSPMTEGEVDTVALEVTKITQIAKEKISGGEIESICVGHTHPIIPEYAEYFSEGDDRWRTISIPPSEGDIKTVYSLVGEFMRYGLDPQHNLESFAVDARGVWYYDYVHKADLESETEFEMVKNHGSEEARGQWLQDMTSFVNDTIDPDIDVRELDSYKQLQHSYRVNLAASVRFVPFSEINEEAPCAGVRPSE